MSRRALAAVVGVGHSKVYRRDEAPLGHLAVEACREAIADAGLSPAEIDGIASNPEQPVEGAGSTDGLDLVTPSFVMQALQLDTRWAVRVNATTVGKALIQAVHAVAAGACKHAIVFRALSSPRGRYGHTDPSGIRGYGTEWLGGQFSAPYGTTPVSSSALVGQRYMHRYGATREQLGQFVVNNRQNALLWEHGYWYQHRPEPLSLDEYLKERMISWPIGLFDCDLPVHGCGALVVTSPERARELPHAPAYVIGTASPRPQALNQMRSLETFREGGKQFARVLYESAGIGPADVDVLNCYDGFSIFPPLWVEILGLAGEGEGMAFLASEESRIGGSMPVNTSGGALGAGRMHGIPQLMDGALQVMGRSGARQVADAAISVAVTGPPTDGAGIVFAREP